MLAFVCMTTIALTGCGNSSKSSNENAEQTETTLSTPAASPLEESISKALEADTAVEGALSFMLSTAENLGSASASATQTESFKKNKETVRANFDALISFLKGETEIEGYTINDISDTTKEKVIQAVLSLDTSIETYISEYKDKAKEKLQQLGSWGWDKSTGIGAYLKDKGLDWLNEVEGKTS